MSARSAPPTRTCQLTSPSRPPSSPGSSAAIWSASSRATPLGATRPSTTVPSRPWALVIATPTTPAARPHPPFTSSAARATRSRFEARAGLVLARDHLLWAVQEAPDRWAADRGTGRYRASRPAYAAIAFDGGLSRNPVHYRRIDWSWDNSPSTPSLVACPVGRACQL